MRASHHRAEKGRAQHSKGTNIVYNHSCPGVRQRGARTHADALLPVHERCSGVPVSIP